MVYFVGQWVVIAVAWLSHVFVDRHADRRTRPRVIELALLWVLVTGGVWAALGGFGHIGPTATEVARQIGYAPSMFQWEVGWADLALATLGIACAWRRLRGTWLTAAVVALVISYGGDAIGHIMQLVTYDNRATANVWAIPSDIVQPLVLVGLLVAYRRTPLGRHAATTDRTSTGVGAH